MTWSSKCMAVAFLLGAAASQAEETSAHLPGLSETERFEWKHVDGYMTPWEYRKSTRRNQRAFAKAAQTAFEETLNSFGISRYISEQGVELTGTAIGLAFKGGELDLNDSETLTLEVDDVVSDDRSIYFNIKLDW